MTWARAWWFTLAYAVVLLAIHIAVTKGTGNLPSGVVQSFGANAGSVGRRFWAQFTSPWFHETWFHLGYNLAVLLATMPVALHAYGPRVLAAALASSPLAGFTVNLLLLLPLAALGWTYAASAVDPRLLGASVVIFAGAGMALVSWQAGVPLRIGIGVAFLAYEALLALAGWTRPFVGVYHGAGLLFGVGWGLAFERG